MSETRLILCGGGSGLVLGSGVALRAGLELTDRARPHILVVLTAKTTEGALKASLNMIKSSPIVRGLSVHSLHEFDQQLKPWQYHDRFNEADLVYIPGGNLERLLQLFNSDAGRQLVSKIRHGQLVAIGTAEGMLPFFTLAFDETARKPWYTLTKNDGGIVPVAGCAQYNMDQTAINMPRRNIFLGALRKACGEGEQLVGLGIAHDAALQICNGSVTVLAERNRGRTVEKIITNGPRQQNYAVYQKDARLPLTQLFGG